MATHLFQNLLKRGKAAGTDTMSAVEAVTWFRNAAMSITRGDPRKMFDTAENFELMNSISPNSIGKLYMWKYDAKWKERLPYWDMYPMDFIVEVNPEKGYFVGLNLHYLAPIMRARLMDALYELRNNTKLDKTTKLQISYGILKNASQYAAFKPCYKKYLFSHVRSNFLYIKPARWDISVLLPLARFQKASQQRIWMESAAKI